MRQIEFKYLTKGLPLIVKKNYNFITMEEEQEDDDNLLNASNPFEDNTRILSKDQVVYFEDVTDDNQIKVRAVNKEHQFIDIDSNILEIDYKYIPFPYYEQELESIYKNENYILEIKQGTKLVSGEDEGRFYGEDIGGGQVVKVINIVIKNGEIYEITVQDQFGNKYHNSELYIYDEAKMNQNSDSITNPYGQLDNEVKLTITKEELTKFASMLARNLYLEHDRCPLMNEEVDYALIDTIVQWQKLNK